MIDELDLDNCHFIENESTFFKKLEEQKFSKTLDLASTDVKKYFTLFADYLKKNKTITSLLLEDNSISDNECYLLESALSENNTLRHLNLSQNSIGENGCLHLNNALKKNTSLKELHLNFNGIDDNGVHNLINGLEDRYLQHLHLNGNKITSLGCSIIAKFICSSNVESIYLNYNWIGVGVGVEYDGLKDISNTLKFNTNLKNLALSNNNISDNGVELLTENLIENRNLKYLNLSGNRISNIGARHIIDLLNVNFTLKTIDVSKNNTTIFNEIHSKVIWFL